VVAQRKDKNPNAEELLLLSEDSSSVMPAVTVGTGGGGASLSPPRNIFRKSLLKIRRQNRSLKSLPAWRCARTWGRLTAAGGLRKRS